MRSMLRPIHQESAGSEDHEGFFSRILTKLNSLWVATTYPFAGKGHHLSLHYASEISRFLAPHIWLGNRVEIGRHTWFHTWGGLGMEGKQEVKVTIEDDCRIAARCTMSAENSIHLERNVAFASDVLIMDHNHAYEDVTIPIWRQGVTRGGRIRIGEGCRIGQGAAILCDKGELVLGPNCVVSPGAVVTRSFPADSVLSGNPARATQKSSIAQACGQQLPFDTSNGRSEETELNRTPETHPTDSSLFASRVRDKSANGKKRDSSERGPTIYSRHGMGEEDPLSWFSRLASKLRTQWLARTYPFASFGRWAWMHYSFDIARSAAPYVSIGEHVGFGRDAKLEVCALSGAVRPVIIMDERSGLQRRCVISARNRIHVMRDVIFGPSVLVMDHGHEFEESQDRKSQEQDPQNGTIRIEEECWIGSGSVIICERGELTIGRHSVVGANSVVRHSIPPYSVVAGDPARIVKQYNFSDGEWVLGCIRPANGAARKDRLHGAGAPS
jgi:acetyltransferase-like isoleucine patch superfamily enzyme